MLAWCGWSTGGGIALEVSEWEGGGSLEGWTGKLNAKQDYAAFLYHTLSFVTFHAFQYIGLYFYII